MTLLPTAVLFAAVMWAAPTPESLYADLEKADHWRQRTQAVNALGELGEAGLPFLVRGTQHEQVKIRKDCYRVLFNKFAGHEQTEAALLRGLDDDDIRYTCCFFAGTQKLESAKPKLWDIYNQSDDLRITAAKSLAEMGETKVLHALYENAGSDWYMSRYQANVGLKALSGRDLNDFPDATNEYNWGEGAFVSGGVEAVIIGDPIGKAERKAQRFTALAAWTRWLRQDQPDLYHILDPYADDAENRLHQKNQTSE